MAPNDRSRGYSFELESNRLPVAVVLPAQQEAVVGSLVKLDGRSSVDPEGTGLTYTWRFSQIPIGSQVEKFGFSLLEDDGSVVSFAPDIIGTYKIELVVSDGSLSSEPTTGVVDTRIILVPHHSGYVPDASFIWNYLSDFWTKVDGRKRFETFWSAAIQIVASEMLRLYQYDYNKSIRDIQEVFQRRWLAFEPGLTLNRDKTTFILADDQAGLNASTFMVDPVTGTPVQPQPQYTSLVAVPANEGDFQISSAGQTIAPRVLRLGDRSYTKLRAADLSRSENYATDGSTTGTNDFYGGGFDPEHEGKLLKILSGAPVGSYLISLVVDAAHVQVTDLDGDPVTLVAASDLEYAVFSGTPSHSAFFADLEQVHAGVEPLAWRLSSTLVSQELDFEEQGVCPGDVLEVEISRVDRFLSSTVYAQVVSVDRNRLGFVLNLEDLEDGVAGTWFTDAAQISLAADLQVSGVVVSIVDGLISYTGMAAEINTLLRSLVFRRSYFETELSPDDEIHIGPFSIKARPVQIVRNRKIPVDPKTVSIPVLQEYIKQPQIIRDGTRISLLTEGGQFEATREPYVLVENLDYVLDDESTISGACSITAGLDEIEIPYGDLIDRSVAAHDTLTLTLGATEQIYEIRQVLSAVKVRVYPTPAETKTGVLFTLARRVEGKFLRFVRSAFSQKNPAPVRLWAEVCYFDNNDAVEDNFGVLVGVTQEQLKSAPTKIPYKSVVAGLMYALTNGPTLANLALSAQILLGLPFTQNAGVITEINPAFRKRDDGSPLYGRILVAAQDRDGRRTGLTNIYLYPHGRQIEDPDNAGEWLPAAPEFSGIADNPETGLPFAVGDAVAQFVPLSRGVQIQDYLATPDWTERLVAQGRVSALLERYHAFQLLVNADLVSASDIDLASQFLGRAKGHYVKFTSALLKTLEDLVDVEDSLSFGRVVALYEAAGLGLPSAMKFDDKDEDGSILAIEGNYYVRYLTGSDLVTTQGSSSVSSAAGGFVTARPSLEETHDEPFLRPGDLCVILEGSNSGRYEVTAVTDDGNLVISNDGEFETAADQSFSVYRPLRNPFWVGTATITTGSPVVPVHEAGGDPGALLSAGVAVGDRLVFYKDTGGGIVQSRTVYTVIEVVPSSVSPYIRIYPSPTEPADQYTAWIVREGLMQKDLVTAYGSSPPDPRFAVNMSLASPIVTFGTNTDDGWLNACLLRRGDILDYNGSTHMIIAVDPSQNRIWISPPAIATVVDGMVNISRPSCGESPITIDILDRIPDESLELGLLLSSSVAMDRLLTWNGSQDVETSLALDFNDLGVVPGDDLLILEGPDSTRDVGYGAGVFPILSLPVSTQIRLAAVLTETNAAPGVLFGIRRKSISP